LPKTNSNMKIVLINTSSKIGGAAIACRRLLVALNKSGHETKMLIRESENGINIVSTTTGKVKKWINFYRFASERFLFFLREKSKSVRFLFSIANVGENISKHILLRTSNIIHLHWINQGFISLQGINKILKLNKPVVWTLHDMWSFTGGCHHSGDCNRFKESCGNCPFLKSPSNRDLSNRIWKRKSRLLLSGNLTIVTCSKWLQEKAKESSLFRNVRVESIPNPIDTDVFIPKDKIVCKAEFNLQQNKKYLLFSAVNVRNYYKGFTFFRDALKILADKYPSLKNEVDVVVLGRTSEELLNEMPLKCIVINSISDESKMASLYNLVDFYVTSSLQENLPNTIMESFACGTPVIAFNVGGIPEMVDHLQNGYLAEYKSADDLAKGIYWGLYEAHHDQLSSNARDKVMACYSEEVVAETYISLYKELIRK